MRCKSFIALGMAMACALASGGVCAQTQERETPSEYALKAAFLYNFTLYTEWPDSAFSEPNTLTICLLGEDQFGTHLDALAAKKSQGRQIKVKRLGSTAQVSANDAKTCNVAYIAANDAAAVAKAAAVLGKRNLLTVGERASAEGKFPLITIFPAGNRFGFDIASSEAQANGLKMSSNLLRLARSVN
jgi:YfiR/HmsC-like